jgi:hypothetical protein
MADTRCANPAYQLEVDEMVLEYLVYNTLKAHIDEWNPDYHNATKPNGHRLEKASKLLSTLDSEWKGRCSRQVADGRLQLPSTCSKPITPIRTSLRAQTSISSSSSFSYSSPTGVEAPPLCPKQAIGLLETPEKRTSSVEPATGERTKTASKSDPKTKISWPPDQSNMSATGFRSKTITALPTKRASKEFPWWTSYHASWTYQLKLRN